MNECVPCVRVRPECVPDALPSHPVEGVCATASRPYVVGRTRTHSPRGDGPPTAKINQGRVRPKITQPVRAAP